MEQARLFIEQNFDAHLSRDTIAQAVCSNKSHLCREFKASAGHTMIEHLTQVHVDAARRLLLTSLSINQVSELVGFEDPYYFSRTTGMPPTAYRNKSSVRSRIVNRRCGAVCKTTPLSAVSHVPDSSQNDTRKPSCMVRFPLPLSILPKFGFGVPPSRRFGSPVLGLFRLKWLNALKASART